MCLMMDLKKLMGVLFIKHPFTNRKNFDIFDRAKVKSCTPPGSKHSQVITVKLFVGNEIGKKAC